MFSLHDKQVIEKILRHCHKIIRFTSAPCTFDSFMDDEEKQDAAMLNILQIGELVKEELSILCKEQITELPWNVIIKMRHKVVHHYEGISVKVV